MSPRVMQAAADVPDENVCTQVEFAARNGWAKSYVTKLKGEGRLVMTDDGKRVLAAESLARIAETTGAPERASAAVVPTALQDLQVAEKRLDVLRKEREEAIELGRLVLASEVTAALSLTLSTLRGKLENLPDRLAPQLAGAGGNEAKIRGLLVEHVDRVLADLHKSFARMAAGQVPTEAG